MNTVTKPSQMAATATGNVSSSKAKTRERTVYYYRAETNKKLSSKSMNLETALVASWNSLALVKNRKWVNTEKTIFGMDMRQKVIVTKKGAINCHVFTIGVAERGAEANILKVVDAKKSSLTSSTYKAPVGSEYLDGEAFICVYGNNILVSPCDALRGNIPNRFLTKLLALAKNQDKDSFNIIQVANVQTLQTIMTEGVKKIDLNASVFMATYEYSKANVKKNTFVTRLASRLDGLVDMITPNSTHSGLTDYDSLHAKLTLSQDLRINTSNTVKEGSALTNDAKDLIESGLKGFTLVTRDGTTITPDKVVMNEPVTVKRHGKSVEQDSMWDALVNQMQKYNDKGLLVQ